MQLNDQRATISSVSNGTYAPNLYVEGQDSGTFTIMGGAGGISGMVGAFRVEGKHMTTRTAPGAFCFSGVAYLRFPRFANRQRVVRPDFRVQNGNLARLV